jgi:hypothetical protein
MALAFSGVNVAASAPKMSARTGSTAVQRGHPLPHGKMTPKNEAIRGLFFMGIGIDR